jgi:hypothetical protein
VVPARSTDQTRGLLSKEDTSAALTTSQSGQCPRPQDHEFVGDQASMQETGPAPRPTSRRSSQSPRGEVQVPSLSSQHGGGSQGNRPGIRDSSSVSVPFTNGEERSYPIPPRTLGVQSLMNPSEFQSGPGSGRPIHQRDGLEGLKMGPGQPFGAPAPFTYQGQLAQPTSHRHVPPMHHHSSTASASTAAPPHRDSPTSTHPLPALNNPRQILSPKLPRASSLGRGGPRPLDAHQPPYMPPAATRAKRPYAAEHKGPHQFAGSPHSLGPPPTLGAVATPPRSLSQPVLGHLPAATTDSQRPLPGATHDPHNRAPQAQSPFQRPMAGGAGRGYPESIPPTPEGGRWPGSMMGNLRTQIGRGMTGPDGQHMIEITPTYGDKIVVPVDVHQASRQADEKRQRNAGASARFRARKKERDQEQQANMHKVEQKNRNLEQRIRDLMVERDHYRDERNRLRDIIIRNPQFSNELAAGPPSPASSRSGGSFAERSPLVTAPVPPPQSQGYASSDASSIERPPRRRRTDSRPEFSVPAYGAPPPATTLPPIPGAMYGGIPPRPLSASASHERLPPLRGMEGQHPSIATTDSPSTTAPPAYPGFARIPYETGWVNQPSRGPPEGGHR